eukprot:5469279-Prymnesium_polylepis.1
MGSSWMTTPPVTMRGSMLRMDVSVRCAWVNFSMTAGESWSLSLSGRLFAGEVRAARFPTKSGS